MANGLTTRDFWRIPTIPLSSWMEGIEDMLPTSNFLNGLSVSEDEKNIYVEAAVPGLDPKNIDVTFQQGILTISGEKKEEAKKKKYHKKATTSFLYRVTPGDVDLKTEPEASYKNGVMTVTFSKAPKGKPMKISVKI